MNESTPARRPAGRWHHIDAAEGWAEYQYAHGGGGIGSNRPPGINHTDRMLDGLAMSFGLAVVFVVMFAWPPILLVAIVLLVLRGVTSTLEWVGKWAHARADEIEAQQYVAAQMPRHDVNPGKVF